MGGVVHRKHYRVEARGRILELGSKTLIMGVLNVTPDSFSDGGLFVDPTAAVARAWAIAEEGADILDIGGESTRPGAEPVPVAQELERVLPVIERLVDYPLPISIDTRKPEVAREALEAGAALVNDVSGLRSGPELAEEAARAGAALVLMHSRGEPATMNLLPPSPDIVGDIDIWAEEAVARARSSGVSSQRLILDPGIGFGKTSGQNLEVLRNLSRLAQSGFPLLVGTSRKSFIGSILNRPAGERAWGNAAAVAAAILFGAHIIRVHEVRAMADVARVADAIAGEGSTE